MHWSSYDAFDRANEWPGSRWVKADLGGGPLWDATAVTHNPGSPVNILSIEVPRFTLFRPPSHSKALMLSTRLFEIADNAAFGSRCDMAVEIFGTDPNPFGVDPGDPRLACGGIVTLDVKTGVVLDFLVTNSRIFAVYERLPYAQSSLGPYPAFTEFIPADITTSPGQWHSFEILYDSSRDLAEWTVDGRLVASHAPVGAPWRQHQPVVRLSGMRIGGSLFTVMDGGVPRVGEWAQGTQTPCSLLRSPEDELFGQGGRIALRDYRTGYRPPAVDSQPSPRKGGIPA